MTVPVALFLLGHPTEHVGVVESTGAAPEITSDGGGATADVSVNTGDTAVTTVVASDTGTITYSIVGGAEALMFEIDPDSGELAFTETSVDGEYEVIVAATSDWGQDRQTITVTVEAGYHADAVHFDGATFLKCNSLSCTDNEFWSGSFWFRWSSVIVQSLWSIDPEASYTPEISHNGNVGPDLGKMFVQGGDNAQSVVDVKRQVSSQLSTGVWHHVIYAGRSDTPAMKIYVDGVASDGTFTSSGSGNFEMNGFTAYIGDGAGGEPNCDLAEFWLSRENLLVAGAIPDATIQKFRTSAGKPVFLGANGEIPTGNVPVVFFSGDATGFATNRGTGGAFTPTGTLTNASTSPSD